jgi:micrococcal nuclease
MIPAGETVHLSRVVSGQTLEIINSAGQSEKVRLIGISAPAWKQEPWYSAAKQGLEDLIEPAKTLRLEFDVVTQETWQDGTTRKLAYVWKGDQLLNETMVEQGWVLAEGRSPNLRYEPRLLHAQEKARLTGVGIWNPQNPMRQTPQDFREQNPGG